MNEKHYWGWPVAGYLFLGGLGGGMLIVSTAADLLWGQGGVFALGSLTAAVLIGLGSGLLIFELGRPLRFWRVFSRQKAVMTVGAWMLGLLIVVGAAFASFGFDVAPWRDQIVLRQGLAVICLLLGVGVVTYTGVLLGSQRARPFWSSPVLPVLFAVSGLSTGMAAQSLMAGAWPCHGDPQGIAQAHALLHQLDAGLLVLELLIVLVYVGMMRWSAGDDASRAAARWLIGSYALAFWGGLVGLGLLAPLLLYGLGEAGALLAPVCVIVGGAFLRFLVVYSDDRKQLPGEARFYARLPHGDEAFLAARESK